MGTPPRTSNNYTLRSRFLPRTLQISSLPQHRPIPLRSHGRLPLPTIRYPIRRKPRAHLPQSPYCLPSIPRRDHICPSLTLWLCLTGAYRLHNVHSREILQVAPSYVPTHYALRKEISSLQICCGSCSYVWGSGLHAACRVREI